MNEAVVFITGALSGIGRATALAFARDGSRIAVAGRRMDAGNSLVAQLQGLDVEAAFFQLDVRYDAQVAATIDAVVGRFGRIDVAANVAGTEGIPGPLTEQTAETYAATFDTNVLGTILSLKHELRVMREHGSGCIINVSSTFGERGAAGAGIYVASKHAVEGLTKSAALEAALVGVRVNAVAPGPVETAMLDRFTGGAEAKTSLLAGVPLKRAATPSEIADAIVFLSSRRASFITGQIVGVDGGLKA